MPFDLPNKPKNQNFEKIKKLPGHIILHLCTTNDDHMMYGYWDIKHQIIFLSFWAIFCPITPLTTQKIKILKKWKNSWRYYHFTHEYHKWKSYDIWFLRYGAWHPPHTSPLTTQRIKIFKKWKKKNTWTYHHFTQAYHQGIRQEFNLGICSHIRTLQMGGGGAVSPHCKSPPTLLYITSRYVYMKHLFCWWLILIFLYLTPNWECWHTILWLECSSSELYLLLSLLPTIRKLFVLVEFENSAMLHFHCTSFPVLLS